jgi:predicted PurR-regulated permease PerM
MKRRIDRICAMALSLALLFTVQVPALAAPIPSEAEDNTVADRETDEAVVQDVLVQEQVADALASFGLSTDEVESRLAKLSDEDIRHLASNLDQIQAAGEQVPEYIWWLAGGLLAVLILAAIL